MSAPYVHGYQEVEAGRLYDQADTLTELLHDGSTYAAGSRVLEVGCGVGAQTVALARRSPGARIIAFDRHEDSVIRARRRVHDAGFADVVVEQADLAALPYAPASFDHVFVCFVLEHLSDPIGTLRTLRMLLRPGGTITVIEGDHGSVVFHPENADARAVIQCQVTLQRQAGGNALIGRELQHLLADSGYIAPTVVPKMVYVDTTRPQWVEGFTRRTFIAMVQAVHSQAVAAGLIERARFDRGLAALQRTTWPDGMFGYTFFKALAQAPA